MTNIKQDENCSNVATGIYPFWANQDGELVELPEKIVNAEGTYNFSRVKTVNFSQDFEQKPTTEQLREKATRYVKNNRIGVPIVSTSVSYAQLEQSIASKGLKILEHVGLFDDVNVIFPALGVENTAKVVKLVYNVILDRVESVTLGSVKQNIESTIANQTQEIEKKPSLSNVQKIAASISANILGANGGAIRLVDTNADGKPDELYVADHEDIEQAAKVWRWNYQGWAGSKNGYNGPFELGATLEDGILANAITAANLVAGTIQSKDGETFFLDLDNGILNIKAMGEMEKTFSDFSNHTAERFAEMQLTAEGLSVEVQGLRNQGATKVATRIGYTFDDDGLRIKKPGEEMENKMDNTGMYVMRSGEPMLTANNGGVVATDVTVRNFLNMGENSRFEDYSDGVDTARTGCFAM